MVAFAGVLGLVAAAGCPAGPGHINTSRFAPPAGQRLLIIGQEQGSVAEYVSGCAKCPTPGGVTTYLGFYDLLSANAGFGGLGEDAAGNAAPDADWGAGKTSAARMRERYPHSALVLGLDFSNGRRPGGLAEVARGVHDDKIARLAKFFAATSQPVYLRIGYEFDGSWNQGYEVHATYVAAYRRIVDGLRARNVDNVAFVWQASASPLDDILEHGHHENLRDWYPGSQYVDWIALSWFLPPHATPRASGFAVPDQLALANEVLAIARTEHKAVMIAESAPSGYDLSRLTRANISPLWNGPAGADPVPRTADEIWTEWYEPLFSFIETNRDLIAALAYINANWDSQPMWGAPYANGYWGDSRIQVNERIEARWLAEIRRREWLHGGPDLIGILNPSREPQ